MEEKTLIIAYDPGKATGVAVWVVEGRNPKSPASFMAWEVTEWTVFCDWLEDEIIERRNIRTDYIKWRVIVIGEHFTIGKRTIETTLDYSALYINGAVKYICAKYDVDFKFQLVGVIKDSPNLADNKNLKTIGWYTPTKGGHANDAVRHLVHYIKDKAYGQKVLRELL